MIELFHGAHTGWAAETGTCLTPDFAVAERYAKGSGIVVRVALDTDALVVRRLVVGYDRETNTAPGDDVSELIELEAAGVDVIVYRDEDEHGRSHTTYRLVSDRAVAACSVI